MTERSFFDDCENAAATRSPALRSRALGDGARLGRCAPNTASNSDNVPVVVRVLSPCRAEFADSAELGDNWKVKSTPKGSTPMARDDGMSINVRLTAKRP